MLDAETVYELAIGEIDIEHYPVEGAEHITDEFGRDMLCANLYEEVYNIKERLIEQTGEEESLERIVDCFWDITQHLCVKMYEYGAKYGK